jgi:hypothetical protein
MLDKKKRTATVGNQNMQMFNNCGPEEFIKRIEKIISGYTKSPEKLL